jgi:peroxiredoxin
LSGCGLFTSDDTTPVRVVTSPLDTSRSFSRSVSLLKSFDRVTTSNFATSFTWWDNNGRTRELREYFGQVVVLYFWGTSSTWSLNTAKELLAAREVLKDSDVVYFGLVHGEVRPDSASIWRIQRMSDSLNMQFQHVIGNNEFSYAYGGINALPTIFVIARNGRVYQTLTGQQSQKKIEEAIRKTLIYTPTR